MTKQQNSGQNKTTKMINSFPNSIHLHRKGCEIFFFFNHALMLLVELECTWVLVWVTVFKIWRQFFQVKNEIYFQRTWYFMYKSRLLAIMLYSLMYCTLNSTSASLLLLQILHYWYQRLFLWFVLLRPISNCQEHLRKVHSNSLSEHFWGVLFFPFWCSLLSLQASDQNKEKSVHRMDFSLPVHKWTSLPKSSLHRECSSVLFPLDFFFRVRVLL